MTERNGGGMDDLISRQAVIDAILAVTGNSSVRELYEHVQEHELSDMWSGGVNAAIDIIIAVPSAQPETHDKHTETHACDLISRQAAIDAHYEYCNKHPDAGFPVWSLKILEDLPSAQPEVLACGEGELIAQPERKKGKWIDRGWSGDGRGNSWHEWECSECKHITKGAKWHFCPNCGADMQRGAV